MGNSVAMGSWEILASYTLSLKCMLDNPGEMSPGQLCVICTGDETIDRGVQLENVMGKECTQTDVHSTDSTQREIAQALSYMEPQVDLRVEFIDVPDRPNHKVIAMHFDGWAWGIVPYTYHGCPYYKVESTTKEMPRDMYDERLRRSKPDMFAWERQPSEFTDISSLDEKLIRGVVRLCRDLAIGV